MKGNRAAALELGINESMVRRWRCCRENLQNARSLTGSKCHWPGLENELEDWVNTHRADGRGVSTVQIHLKAKVIVAEKNIEDFRGGRGLLLILLTVWERKWRKYRHLGVPLDSRMHFH